MTPPNTLFGVMMIGATTVNVTYTGGYAFAQTAGGVDYWRDESANVFPAYDGVNAPPTSDLIALGAPTLSRLTFDQPIFELYMAIVSMGQPSLPVTYDFSRDFAIVDEGSGWWVRPYVGAFDRTAPNQLSAAEGNGVIKFAGPVTALEFASTPSEFWHGFTIGAAAPTTVPEPGTVVLLGTGLAGLAGYGLRRRRRSA